MEIIAITRISIEIKWNCYWYWISGICKYKWLQIKCGTPKWYYWYEDWIERLLV